MPGQHGGRRAGSGRTTKATQSARQQAERRAIEGFQNKILENMPSLVEALIAKALEGDKEALLKCLEYGVGKPNTRQHEQASGDVVLKFEVPRPKPGEPDVLDQEIDKELGADY